MQQDNDSQQTDKTDDTRQEERPQVRPPVRMTPHPQLMVVVRYGYLSFIGEFVYDGKERLVPEQTVLVQTDRGLEIGNFLGYRAPCKEGLVISKDAIVKYLKNSGEEYLRPHVGRLIRTAKPQDIREQEHIRADSREKMKYCGELAQTLGLKMKVVCVEHLFGGERVVFYFTAEGRIDFRDLVRDLAREYQTRIELRQIGARDEARLLADYEICGRQCCCKNFLKLLRPVNMKMAKLQKATLDPSKVSGRCGRLRCCLAFEHECYSELVGKLPKIGSYVQTEAGIGRVRDRHILTQLVQVFLEDGRSMAFPIDEVSPARRPEPGDSPAAAASQPQREAPIQPKAEKDSPTAVQQAAEQGADETNSEKPEETNHPRRRRRRSRRGPRQNDG